MNVWVVEHRTLSPAYRSLIRGNLIQGCYTDQEAAVEKCLKQFKEDIHILKTLFPSSVFTVWRQDYPEENETILRLYDRAQTVIATKALSMFPLHGSCCASHF